ncbi:RagB/SusD family nutrient uptake outer membrane protein [Niabella pedocola]|uniref:RagB/SusD family nutrient uptake outer membrane protein n=1 Tax=Niabella pedocola TaxID=1752077 RepID=A0ABS8PKH7_9BACT|nr:RagB/SusD family nutrient uptake outer membrane protein [Niabella pedocola]MCD2421605.1 RagB/SusD family nutrient uptake outer membrane protein [Niabella pedocola]
MKTSIKNWSVATALLLALGSCKPSFLDRVNPNLPVEETYWKTESDAQAAIATIYSPIRGQMYGYYGGYTGWHTMNRADDIWFFSGEEQFSWEYANFTNTAGTAESEFGRLYTGVNRANVFLKNISRVTMDEERRKQLIGEASFMRGIYYFLLASNFGDVPLRLVPAGDDPDGSNKPASPEAAVWKQVAEDFKTAKNNLPVTRPAAEAGRATRGAAIAFLGKTYVYMKSYTEAETELKALLSAPYTYDLTDDFEDNFKETTELNKESVFELQYDGKYGSGSWGAECATCTQGFVIPNFAGPAETGAWFKWMPGASVVKDFIAEERPAGSDTRFDKRMYTSFFWKYSDYNDKIADGAWFGNQSFDKMWDNASGKRQRGEPVYPVIDGKTGRFLIKKFTNFYKNVAGANSMYDQANQNNNFRMFRFAEVLLLHAEACIKNGNLPDAIADLKRIRKRAGLNENKTWNGADALMNEVIKQNELEFFFEGHRFFDLKRTYPYAQMKQIFTDNKKQGAEYFQAKHYYLPIPESELNTNTAIQQHPLWR